MRGLRVDCVHSSVMQSLLRAAEAVADLLRRKEKVRSLEDRLNVPAPTTNGSAGSVRSLRGGEEPTVKCYPS